MQDRYVGDIGDFGKIALLRTIAESGLRLGVIWYLNTQEEKNSDGRFVHYSHLRACDEDLYDSLQNLVKSGSRSIAHLVASGVLPPQSLSCAHPVPKIHGERAAWFRTAVDSVSEAQVVFVDPDNGISGNKPSAKHTSLEEIERLLNRGQSVVAYHHLTRHGTHGQQIQNLLECLSELRRGPVFALHFRKQSPRVFFVVPTTAHEASLRPRLEMFATTRWREHFDLLEHTRQPSPRLMIDVCETQTGGTWTQVDIHEALALKGLARWTGGRCIECHEPKRPHKLGTTNQRAHFEHMKSQPNCSRSPGSKSR